MTFRRAKEPPATGAAHGAWQVVDIRHVWRNPRRNVFIRPDIAAGRTGNGETKPETGTICVWHVFCLTRLSAVGDSPGD